jgi:hypothetical protein
VKSAADCQPKTFRKVDQFGNFFDALVKYWDKEGVDESHETRGVNCSPRYLAVLRAALMGW